MGVSGLEIGDWRWKIEDEICRLISRYWRCNASVDCILEMRFEGESRMGWYGMEW